MSQVFDTGLYLWINPSAPYIITFLKKIMYIFQAFSVLWIVSDGRQYNLGESIFWNSKISLKFEAKHKQTVTLQGRDL